MFDELDYCPTEIGTLTRRRRRELKPGVDVYEIKLGEEFVMTSLFTASEIALTRLGLAARSGGRLDVVVGSLGLGYTALADDPRCQPVQADFFAMAASKAGFYPERPGRRFDAVLVDIDHTPDFLLHDRSGSFYQPEGLRAAARHLKPGGVFGLWSNNSADERFPARLQAAFARAWAEPVTFHNPLTDRPFIQTVYLAEADAEGAT